MEAPIDKRDQDFCELLYLYGGSYLKLLYHTFRYSKIVIPSSPKGARHRNNLVACVSQYLTVIGANSITQGRRELPVERERMFHLRKQAFGFVNSFQDSVNESFWQDSVFGFNSN